MTNDFMIEFRIKGPMGNRLGKVGQETASEPCLLRVSQILCLFPEHHQIRTTTDRTIEVFSEDWEKVERAFRHQYLGGKVTAQGGL